MTISEQINVLCARLNISKAELARRLGTSPQNFNAKLKRGSFTINDLESIASVSNIRFMRYFELNNGDRI